MSDTKPQDAAPEDDRLEADPELRILRAALEKDRIRRTELEAAKECPKGRGGPGRGQGRKRELESSERKTYSLDWESRKVITAVQHLREARGEKNASASAALREILASYGVGLRYLRPKIGRRLG